MSLELFSNQEICHINLNGEKIICTVSTYIKEFLSIVEIDNKIFQRCSKLKTPVELISDNWLYLLRRYLFPISLEYWSSKMYYIDKRHYCLGWHITEIFQGFIFRRCYMWKSFIRWFLFNKINIHCVKIFRETPFSFEDSLPKRKLW